MTQKFTSPIVIGLEIHVQLNTDTKIFCNCPTQGTDDPNARVCPVCLGHPGSKPVLNKKVVEYGLKLALATKSKIAKELIFSRKSYFYPDMSKNYQITQYEIPLCTEGKLKLKSGKEIGLTRIHLEEDPAALVHPGSMQGSAFVLVDYNRSGNPLAEIVTKPELTGPSEARDFMNQLITVLEYLEIFDVNNCIIKADANVSVKESGYVRSEIKNITGFKDIERALKYEVERQKKEISEGKKLKQETRAWDASTGTTFTLRVKEVEEEYGYIIDPDLVKIELKKDWIDSIKKTMPELAEAKLSKFVQQHGIDAGTAEVLSKDKALALMFEKVAAAVNPDLASKWIRRELPRVLNYNKKTLAEVELNETHLIDLLTLIDEKKITDTVGQKIIEKLVEKPFDVNEYVQLEGLAAVSDKSELQKFCKEAIKENPQAVEDYKKGEAKALHFLMGQVMRKSKGKATPKEVVKILMGLVK
ncbi:Asp-tRNA(Asn)/Glu-tRNA(Gln) amidotransferase subunit GatB [Candidatus Woesearchaeota archaeon]|nr:Asp-tRNA(Asn)/Glu-tRNA(Gln) amidotransferase subunit GatB [Candidatus Woesearchaeota archaeon]